MISTSELNPRLLTWLAMQMMRCVAIAHCKDIAAPAAEGVGHRPGERLYAHVAAGTGILDYRHYLSELGRLTPTGVPLILHGLSEEQIPRSLADGERTPR